MVGKKGRGSDREEVTSAVVEEGLEMLPNIMGESLLYLVMLTAGYWNRWLDLRWVVGMVWWKVVGGLGWEPLDAWGKGLILMGIWLVVVWVYWRSGWVKWIRGYPIGGGGVEVWLIG